MPDSGSSGIEAPPKILVFAGGFAPVGGVELFARNLAMAWVEAGSRVSLAFWPNGPRNRLLDELDHAGVRFVCGFLARGQRWDLPDRALVAGSGGAIACADLIYLLKLPPPPALARLLRRARRPSRDRPRAAVVYVPPYCPAEDETYRTRPVPPPALLNRIDGVVAQCPAMESQVRDFLGYDGEVRRAPYLPDSAACGPASPAPLPPTGPGAPFRIGSIGRLSPQKNVPALVRAFERLPPRDDRRVELHLYGTGNSEGEIRVLADRSPCSDRIRVHGAYRPEDVPRIAAENHIFAQRSRFEGQCLAAIEVGMAGRILVASDAGCVGDVLRDPLCGALLPREPVARLADSPAEETADAAFASALNAAIDRVLAGEHPPERVAAIQRGRFNPSWARELHLRIGREVVDRVRG